MKVKTILTLLAVGALAGLTRADEVTIKGLTWRYSITAEGTACVEGLEGYGQLPPKLSIPATCGKYRVTAIGKDAFMYPDIAKIQIPAGVTSIGSGAFAGTKINTVILPAKLTSIEDQLFQECKHLASIKIPVTVKRIGVEAFTGCESLTAITIPESVTEIGRLAFNKCPKLKTINLGNGELAEQLAKDLPGVKLVLSPKAKKALAAKAAAAKAAETKAAK